MSILRAVIPPLIGCALSLLGCRSALAQTVLHLPGKTVEVIGLEDWTLPMLEDSLRKHSDGVTLASHACAAVLRERLGFADAAVVSFARSGDTTVYVAVSVVEPADSARVRRRTVGQDTLGFPSGWEAAGTLLRLDGGARWALSNGVRELPATIPHDSIALGQLWAFVDRVRDSTEYAAAARVLESHPNVYARLLTAAVLRNAPADRLLLYALVRAMRDDAGIVSVVAATAVGRMAQELRGMDWTPVVEDVHALLDGSNLFVLDALISALVESGVDRRWAVPFLAGGGHAVLARMAAEDRRMWMPARALLVALRGADLGRDPAAWQGWSEALRAPPEGVVNGSQDGFPLEVLRECARSYISALKVLLAQVPEPSLRYVTLAVLPPMTWMGKRTRTRSTAG